MGLNYMSNVISQLLPHDYKTRIFISEPSLLVSWVKLDI